jgi:antitoxin HicB
MVTYPAIFEPAEEGGFVVTFPDFGYGATQGESEQEAMEMATDLLECLVSDAIGDGKELPAAGKYRGKKIRAVRLAALQSAKAELHRTFLASGVRKTELARRLGMSRGNVDRLFDLKHQSRLDQLEAAFAAIGKRLSVLVDEAA